MKEGNDSSKEKKTPERQLDEALGLEGLDVELLKRSHDELGNKLAHLRIQRDDARAHMEKWKRLRNDLESQCSSICSIRSKIRDYLENYTKE